MATPTKLFDPAEAAETERAPYVYSQDVVNAVNVAFAAGRPLLVSGPPGMGKSSLAPSVALVLGWQYLEYRLNARTRPQDLLWTFDDVRRLNDAQVGELPSSAPYIRRGVLWEAFDGASRAVVLLDDIDRADRQVDELLLDVLGTLRFEVNPTGEVVAADGDVRPFVIVTTSEERLLDMRFARRCVGVSFYPPDLETLVKIARVHGLADEEQATRTAEKFVITQAEATERGVAPLGVTEYLDTLRAQMRPGPETANPFASLLIDRDRWTRQPQQAAAARYPVRTEGQGPRIFLCHSSGDKAKVRTLYRRLTDDGMRPWLDERDILPGQDWQRAITRAVHEADLVVVCLSNDSIAKRGYVQREIKDVLDVADEMPDDRAFIVPAKLEECPVPERLRRWQWVNLHEPDGYELLLKTTNSVVVAAS